MKFFNISPEIILTTNLKSIYAANSIKYQIRYSNNVVPYASKYNINYNSKGLTSVINKYNVSYTSLYGDSFLKFSVRYTSGVELNSISDRYLFAYTNTGLTDNSNSYIALYNTTGGAAIRTRDIYRVRYKTSAVQELISHYTINYNRQNFKERILEYTIKYSTEAPTKYIVTPCLLRTQNRTDVLFIIESVVKLEKIDPITCIFSNLPRYQLISFNLFAPIKNPYITLEPELVQFLQNDLSLNNHVVSSVLIKNIEENNELSFQLYNQETLIKLSDSQSYFFSLNSNNFKSINLIYKGDAYIKINTDSNLFDYKYLNFIESSLTPVFKVQNDCCFDTKIKSSNNNSRCAPF